MGQLQLLLLREKYGGGAVQLRRNAGAGNGRGCNIAGQGQARSIQFEAAVIGASRQRFQCTPVAASQIEVVMHAHAGVVEAEWSRVPAQPLTARAHLLALGAQHRIYLGILCRARRCGKKLPRLTQIGIEGRERRAALQSVIDQGIKCRRTQASPPLRRYRKPFDQLLFFTEQRRCERGTVHH